MGWLKDFTDRAEQLKKGAANAFKEAVGEETAAQISQAAGELADTVKKDLKTAKTIAVGAYKGAVAAANDETTQPKKSEIDDIIVVRSETLKKPRAKKTQQRKK